ncbi:MAG: GTP cyclohydrolase FolE2 [Gemmataceae bacterium]
MAVGAPDSQIPPDPVRTIMEDVQNRPDARSLPIDQVGVSDLRYPITVLDRANGHQHTVARWAMSVSLPHQFKGTHMSRFIEVLNRHRGEVTLRTMPTLLAELRERLHAERARVEIEFPYFLERIAPVTGATALMEYECRFVAEAGATEDEFVLGVRVPVGTLCPCSKAISDYGAHNQRGIIDIAIRTRRSLEGQPQLVWIEELVELAERSGSCPVYPLLKRPDERHVTMQAYDNPAFVEDVVRNAAVVLRNDERVSWFRVHAVNFESIHNHNAFARIEWSRPAYPPH